MILILEIGLGVLLGWLLIQAVQQLLKMPQKQLDRAKADTESAVENALRKLDKERVEQELRDMSRELNHLQHVEYTAKLYIKEEWPEKNLFADLKPESDVTGTELEHHLTGRPNYFYRVRIEKLHKSIAHWQKLAEEYLHDWSETPEGQRAKMHFMEWESRRIEGSKKG